MSTPAVATLTELLGMRTATMAAGLAYGFLPDGENERMALTYAALDGEARALAARLRERIPPGACALLAYPPGLEFIVAFFGCLYAGIVAVPVCAPHPRKGNERLAAIATDCDARHLLTTAAGERAYAAAAAQHKELHVVQVLATELNGSEPRVTSDATVPSVKPGEIAFLQYTSGSTQRPRGVMVTHANLIANLAAIHAAEGNDATSRGVTWLPAYHDMGLIEGILQPLYGGYPTWLMPHTAFLQRPARWLAAISKYRATVSGGPNFAYDLCVRRVADAELAALDLASWKVAYCGAEPVRADTLNAFATRYAACGLRRSALRPVYGLAEATLLVAASERTAEAPRIVAAQKRSLEQGRYRPTGAGDPESATLVFCGPPAAGTRIAILAPETGATLPEGVVGEVWVSGPGVSCGYFERREESDQIFVRRNIAGCTAVWLRTGDLGFLQGGELCITGRAKDLIILRGRKLHPQDIEHTVERTALDSRVDAVAPRIDAAAAFAIEAERGEGLVICAELDPAVVPSPVEHPERRLAQLSDAIRDQVYREHDIAVETVAFVRRGALARTSSGKLMRYRCRSDLADGRLAIVARFDTRALAHSSAQAH